MRSPSSLIILSILTLSALANGEPRKYGKAPADFSQDIRLPGGKVLRPQSQPLPQRRTLDFTVAELPVDQPISPESSRAILLERVERIQRQVSKCLALRDGKPTRSNDEILRELQKAVSEATGEMKRDLKNLLISGVVSTEVKEDDGTSAIFKTWSYRQIDDVRSLCGPTIVAHPNTTLLIPVLNLMDRRDLEINGFPVQDPVFLAGADTRNTPHGFDTINLHTHGLNVSPNWPADDVFREVHPFQLKFFVYHLYDDHPVGTFWYHPHKHGAVGPQVASGMAGALLVQGLKEQLGLDRVALAKKWGEEDPLIFQQLTAYEGKATGSMPNPPFVFRPDFFALKNLLSNEDADKVPEIGPLVAFMKANLAEVRPKVKILISGQYQPTLHERKAGETFRLRLIHGGIESDWMFGIQRIVGMGPTPNQLHADQPGPGKLTIQVIAWDGLALERPYIVSDDHPLILSPGNRAEVLVHFCPGAEGEYGISDLAQGESGIARFHVGAGADNAAALLTEAEISSERLFKEDPGTETNVVTEFRIKYEDKTIAPTGRGGFELLPGKFQINDSPFPGTPKFNQLGITAPVSLKAGGHPIHIHVNPFLLPADPARKADGRPDGRYWTDTAFVPNEDPGFRGVMPFEHFSGKTVVHCHILDHEDNGMMNTFIIRPSTFPIAPLPGVFDLTSLSPEVHSVIRPSWPKVAAAISGSGREVTVLAFLPRSGATKVCTHCADSVGSIARLRQTTSGAPFRIVAVTGPNDAGIEELAEALKLDPMRDVLCVDPKLEAFQAMALIDGVPVFDKGFQRYKFPSSFNEDGSITYDGDVMHGLFILDPKGFVVSSNRGFFAYDDTEQTLEEIKLARDVPGGFANLEKTIVSLHSVPDAENSAVKQERLNLQRQQIRYREFERSAEEAQR